MGIMVVALVAAFVLATAAQEPDAGTRLSPVRYDSNGWPIVPDLPAPRAVAADADRGRQAAGVGAAPPGSAARPTPPEPAAAPPAAGTVPPSGMELGSPLLDLYQFARSPSAFKALAGQVVWWRLTIHGAQGETLGIRELTHVADCAFAERDRLEHEGEGRVYGRSGSALFAERQGMPWPSDAPRGEAELALFGTHLRVPWCFANAGAYAVTAAGVVERPEGRLRRIVVERRPRGGTLIGPELDPGPRDRFELVYEPGTGRLRELVHRFAASGMTRRVLLEDWRDHAGVRIPWRRTYVDDAGRPTTTLEILDITPQQVGERTFRPY